MIYPKFLNNGSTIGVCAPSAGVGHKLDEYLEAIDILKNQGYKIKETSSVRASGDVSNTALLRAKEVDEVVLDKDVDMIITATGGDVQIETLSLIDYDHIKENPKWIMGFSDPTILLYPVTTMLDIATLYGNNVSYTKDLPDYQRNNLEFIKGNIQTQYSYDKYLSFLNFINEKEEYEDVFYKSNKDEFEINGRCIGGCLDCIEKIIGTKYDYTNKFIEKYKEDGFIWYLDIFGMSAFNVYLTLVQFKNAGYLDYCKGIMFSRVAFPNTNDSNLINDYEIAYKRALEDIPYISETDIGHSKPRFTMINGAMMNLKYKDHKASIKFDLI